MPRIGIITCSNCTGELNCASTVCLGDMRKRKGLFERYGNSEVVLLGIVSCAGCPTVAAPEKILRRVKALADRKADAIHLSYCMTAVCPFLHKYIEVIRSAYPKMELIEGTHQPPDKAKFREGVKELLCAGRRDMTDYILGK